MSTAKKSRRPGRLIPIGGNEDKDLSKAKILPEIVKLAGGRRARIVVCGSPSADPGQKERIYRKIFEGLGAGEVFEADIHTRLDAERPELVEQVRRATAIFFTGGDQLRLTSLIAGTPFGDCIQERLWQEGLIVAGTSAGAAAMSSTMVIGGSDEGTVRRADVQLAPGLGYMRDTTVDTHFAQRGRISRLLAIFAQNPQVLGIGLDEDTGIIVTPGKRFEVIGSGAVFVFDGRVTHSNAPEASDDEVLALTDSHLHVLPVGYGFDLETKRPILPNGKVIEKHSE
jgi:cyanophycinase